MKSFWNNDNLAYIWNSHYLLKIAVDAPSGGIPRDMKGVWKYAWIWLFLESNMIKIQVKKFWKHTDSEQTT